MTRRSVFNFDNVNEQHQEAAEEIVRVCKELGHTELAKTISSKFKLVEIPKYDFDNSEFIKACRAVGLDGSVQGFVRESDMEYHVVLVCDDIRRLDEMIRTVKLDAINSISKS